MKNLFILLSTIFIISCSSEVVDDTDNQIESKQITNLGKILYKENCASCHGINLEGNSSWQTEVDEDGHRLPPPLDGSGHTWHHSKEEISSIIRYGLGMYDDNYEGKMIGNKNLSDEEISLIYEYIYNMWPQEIRKISR